MWISRGGVGGRIFVLCLDVWLGFAQGVVSAPTCLFGTSLECEGSQVANTGDRFVGGNVVSRYKSDSLKI